MGMQNPEVNEPLDKFSEVIGDDSRFYLTGIRVVHVNTRDYGEGDMVVVRVRGHEREIGVWGSYLVSQAKAATSDDLNKWYVLRRRVVEGFGKGRPVKVFDPAPNEQAAAATADPAGEDHPF